MFKWFRSGTPWIWVTAGAVSISLVSVLGLLLLIGWKGLSYFWPSPIHQWQLASADTTSVVIGEVYERKNIPVIQLEEAGVELPKRYSEESVERVLVKVGNREQLSLDFMTLLVTDVIDEVLPLDVAVIERTKNGNFYGYPVAFSQAGSMTHELDTIRSHITSSMAEAKVMRDEVERLQKGDIGRINWRLEQLRLEHRKLEMNGQLSYEQQHRIEAEQKQLEVDYEKLEKQLFALRLKMERDQLIVRDMLGNEVAIPMAEVLDFWLPNNMTTPEKAVHWLKQIKKFLTEDPREANSEGGVYPAIFGTVFMVLLMSILVTPLGVVAAVYLHEYAGNNSLTRMIRIAVINLAGVPSIVYGVFGLGFFVYMVGGTLDRLFYAEALPAPTFGTPGMLWSALTLAILTLPVVIVSTEEGLSRIPSSVRHGSLALGATKSETLWRIVLPMASPAIMTGLILAVARAAGEVAPLMLVGVVKLAPSLPVDANFPYVHLERKFMHLGFHIYDVGFQSPNVEAARPLVYATSFLLVSVIIGLNLTAIGIRNYLREKYRSLEQ